MTVAFKQGSVFTEVGPGGVLQSFFSTIASRLEGGLWGSRFPTIMNSLYQGSIQATDAQTAISEMTEIRAELGALSPDYVVWDADAPGVDPPWGRQVGDHVKCVADYFVTTTGRNLIAEIFDNLESLEEFGGTLDVVSFDGMSPE